MISMTGYGAGSAESAEIHVEAEIHTVNQRGLQVNINAPREWGGIESEVTNRIRQSAKRGKFSVQLQFSRKSEDGDTGTNWEEVDRRVQVLQKAMDRHDCKTPLSPEVLYRILGDSDREAGAPAWETAQEIVFSALDAAIENLCAMRAEEGARLLEEFLLHIRLLRDALTRITKLDRGRTIHHRDALLARLRQMNLELDLEDERVVREVAFLADRGDISEEITRIGSHLDALSETASSEEPIGRKIEFLLQELHREFNTVGSKANLAELSAVVIEAKQELEKLKEQSANVE